MFEQDEDEFWRLQTGISTVEALLANGGIAGNTGVTSMLVTFIENAKLRVNVLEREGLLAPEDEKKKKATQETALVQYLVEKETALSAGEREQYGAFLNREYFTRNDFDSLEGFYAHTWDKLTETGKAQMSHRVWEGVRSDEYMFSELPETVKEKEAQRLYEAMEHGKSRTAELNHIPANDTQDFVRAWKSKQQEEAYHVLDRRSFAENVAVTAKPMPAKSEAEKAAPESVVTGPGTSQNSTQAASDAVLSDDLLAQLETSSKPTALPMTQDNSSGRSLK